MLGRCTNPNNRDFVLYGGRGIRVCARWSASFESFLADMGERPTKRHSIDRIDNNGDYEPGNCRWATPLEQNRNRRNTRLVTFKGETLALAEWSQRTGIAYHTLKSRLLKGWDSARALTTKTGTA